jgi:molybdenum cofactor biosynthesis enzyme MoaA
MGETKINRVWKELKDKGFLIQEKKCISGKFEYAYSLANAIVQKVVEKVKKVLDKNKDKEKSELFIIDGLKHNEIKELIDLCGDEAKAREYIEYSKKMSPSNLFRYAKNAIIKKFDISRYSSKGGKALIFTDYEQREYDFNKLEDALLYGESYDLPV